MNQKVDVLEREKILETPSREEMQEASLREEMLDALSHAEKAYQRGDYATAIKYYTHAAQAGSEKAEGCLGFCFYYGLGVLPNKQRAKDHWEQGARRGDIRSLYKLGDMFRNGDLPQDLEQSHEYYRKAFQLALESEDLEAYPNAYLRMLRDYPEEASSQDQSVSEIAHACADGIAERIRKGDRFSQVQLLEARKYEKELV